MLLVDVIKSWLSGPKTIKYPREKGKPKNYRGKISWDNEKCIRCLGCIKVCPSYAIKLEKKKLHERGEIKIDFGKCIFCYYCVERCPVGALKGSTEFEMATHDKKELGSA